MWPHFSFDPTLQIPLHAAIHLHNLSRLLSKYDGSGLISPTSLEYLTSITPFLPKTIGVNLTFSTLPLKDITAILTHLSSLSLRIRLLSLPLPHLFSTSPQNNPFTDSTFTSTLKTLSAEAYIFLGDTQPPHASILKYMPSLRILCFFNPTLFPCSVLTECQNITCLFVQKPRCSVEALKELVDALTKTGLWKVVFEWEGEEGEKGLETVRSLEVHVKEVGWSVRDDEGKVSWRRKV